MLARVVVVDLGPRRDDRGDRVEAPGRHGDRGERRNADHVGPEHRADAREHSVGQVARHRREHVGLADAEAARDLGPWPLAQREAALVGVEEAALGGDVHVRTPSARRAT
jgi:hypothetical protein